VPVRAPGPALGQPADPARGARRRRLPLQVGLTTGRQPLLPMTAARRKVGLEVSVAWKQGMSLSLSTLDP
jgi:hypothetical protein